MKKLFLCVGQRFFRFYPYLQIYNHEQTKNSPSGHPTRKKELWVALSQSAKHPSNAVLRLAWSLPLPKAGKWLLSLSPFRCWCLCRYPSGGLLHRPWWLQQRWETAGPLGTVSPMGTRTLCSLRLRSLRPLADSASPSAQRRLCPSAVRPGPAGNRLAPFATAGGGVARRDAS